MTVIAGFRVQDGILLCSDTSRRSSANPDIRPPGTPSAATCPAVPGFGPQSPILPFEGLVTNSLDDLARPNERRS